MEKTQTFIPKIPKTHFLIFFLILLFPAAIYAQTSIGDYRSNVNPTGLWSAATSWQTWNGASWVTASMPPSSSSGVITILNGDSIRLDAATNFDQVTIDNGGILAIFNQSMPSVFTLNDGAGTFDMEVNGKLYVSVGATLSGAGQLRNNNTGMFILRNQGILQVATTNNGTVNVSGTGNIQNNTLTNNGTLNLLDFTLNLNNASLSNNGTMNFSSSSSSYIATTTGTGTLTNTINGVIHKISSSGLVGINSTITFINNGTVKGRGEYQFLSSTITNTGTISPGNSSTSQLTINPLIVSGKSPTFEMEINSTGGVAGTNYDQIVFTTQGGNPNSNLTGSILKVTDNAADPVGTTYTLFSSPSGSITGPFAQVILSPTLGNLTYTSNLITVQKTSLGRHWVGSYLFQSNFNSASEINEWTMIENNGTGNWSLSGNGSALMTMDNAAGGYAMRLFHQTGGVPTRFPLDKVNGVIEFRVLSLTGGNQRFFLQAQEFDASGIYLSEQNILSPQNTTGYFTINLSSITWNPLATQIRFMIAGENLSAQQGTIEFDYFKYTNTNQNWNNPGNWSTLPGGPGGASVPISSDAVFFDNVRNANCIIDQPVTVSAIIVNPGYTGMISQGINTITVNNNVTFSGGTFFGGSANITVGGSFTLSGASFISTSGTLELRSHSAFNSGTFTHNNGSVRYHTINSTNQQISGLSPTFYNLEFVGLGRTYGLSSSGNVIVLNNLTTSGTSSLRLNTGNIEARGNIIINNTSAGGGGSATLFITGTGTQNINSTISAGQGALPKVTINKPSGILIINNIISVSNDWTYTTGIVDASTNSSAIVFGGSNLNISAAGMSFYDVIISSNIITLNTDITINRHLTINGSGVLSAQARTINLSGNWTNYGTSGFTEGTSTLNLNGTDNQSITCPGGENLFNLNISSGSSLTMVPGSILFIAGTWTNNGTFTPSTGIVTFNGTLTQTISGASTTTFYDLNIDNTTGVSLSSNTNLIHTLTLGNNAKFTTTGFEFVLLSDTTGTARIAAIPSGVTFNGNIRVQRYIPSQERYWHHLASPVINATVSMWQSGAPSNGFYVTGPFSGASNPGNGISASGVSAYSWDETSGIWSRFPASSNTEVITSKKGYRVFIRDGNAAYNGGITSSKVFSVSGLPAIGDQTFSLSYHPDGGIPAGGWNLIGNPYASDINGDLNNSAWSTKTNLDGNAIYMWDSDTRKYVSCNGGLGNCIVPSSQAFWVKVKAGGGTLVATENVKTSGSLPLYKLAESSPNYIPVILINTEYGEKDITYFRFEEDATKNFDHQYDAYKLGLTASGVSASDVLLSSLMDTTRLSINARNMPQNNDTILLNINGYPGNYRLDFSGRDHLDNSYQLYLIDHYKDSVINLNQEAVYSFSIDIGNSASFGKRFEVVFSIPVITSSQPSVQNDRFTIHPNPASSNNFTIIAKIKEQGNVKVTICDIVGNKVFEDTYSNNDFINVEMSKALTPGTYIVHIKNENVEDRTKLIIE